MATEAIKPRSATDIAPGVVRTEAEKQKIEEEKRKAAEEAERIAAEEAARKINEEKEKRKQQKKNSLLNKAIDGLKKFSKKIVEDE